jgi:hypothetical protein
VWHTVGKAQENHRRDQEWERMSVQSWIVLIFANVPLYWLVGWVIFRDRESFLECLKFWLTPDIVSLFKGEWAEDSWAEMKLLLWIALCAGAVYGESLLLAGK